MQSAQGQGDRAMVRVKSPQDLGAAFVFIAIGAAGLYFGRDLAFGALIERIGLALTTALLTIGAAYARRHVDLKETLLLAAGLSLFAVGVFVYGLSQPLPAWWGR